MNAKLAIAANDKFLTLPSDFQLDIEEKNPIWNDNEMFSYPVELPLDGNRHLFGNMDDRDSSLRGVDIEHTPMQIYVEGMPYRSGLLVTDDDGEITEKFSMSINAQDESFESMVEDMTLPKLKQARDLTIGYMIGNVRMHYSYGLKLDVVYNGKKGSDGHKTLHTLQNRESTEDLELQALGFSVPTDATVTTVGTGESNFNIDLGIGTGKYINVSAAYGETDGANRPAAYCNARVCFTDYKKGDDGETSESKVLDKTYSPYRVLDADRMQSGICFYVLYAFECLFHTLGLTCDFSGIKKGDLKRLCFFNTRCKYNLEAVNGTKDASGSERWDFDSITAINNWLAANKTAKYPLGKLETDREKYKQVNKAEYNGTVYTVGEGDVKRIEYETENVTFELKARLMRMIANSDNFPDTSVKSFLDSMFNAFGIKVVWNYETKTAKAVLIRDVLRDQRDPIRLHGTIHSVTPLNEKRTGVWQHYEEESDDDEKAEAVKNNETDRDTNYDYEEYDKVDTSLTYKDIINKKGVSDTTCYVDLNTGNRYRIKVNGEADSVGDLEPVIFEVGMFHGVKDGDCSKKNEDYITELAIGFQPMIFNDVNAKNELADTTTLTFGDGSGTLFSGRIYGDQTNLFAAFIDKDFEYEDKKVTIKNVFGDDYSSVYLNEVFECSEAYNPSDTNDANSPLQEEDYGFTLSVMRGGGANATVQNTAYDFDGFGNNLWGTSPGMYALTSDSISNWGEVYDYNGTLDGVGETADRFSLKLRAYAINPATGEPMCNSDVMNRGINDVFMREYIHWLLNRKKFKLKCDIEVAEVLDIHNHWDRKFELDGMVFMVDKVNTHISVDTGLDEVELTVFTV